MANTYPCHLYIAEISIGLSKWGKNVHSAEARIANSPVKAANTKRRIGKTLLTFVPPMKLSIQDSFSVHLVYNKNDQPDRVHFDVNDIFQAYGAHAALGGPEKQKYRTPHRNFNFVLKLSKNSSTDQTSDLLPATDEIFHICPRFRILVTGKTGVGKSSLIEHAFGVEKDLTSNLERGEAKIDTEFISPQNNKFVLHDSKGFEPGEEDNIKIVREFIERRGKMPDLRDQLHAVWLCFETPSTGGRLLETGTGEFLKLRHEGKLGNIPVIVVFTKYDRLIDQVDYELGPSGDGLSDNAIKELVKGRAETKLREVCIKPLEEFAGSDIPHAAISTKDDYKDSLIRLIQITEEHVYKHVAADASVMASIAQRVDHGLKIKASINVGKRKYWNGLASCAGVFKDRTAGACIYVVHTDIVAVWNFNDPHRYLSSKDFRTLVMNTVEKLEAGPPASSDPGNTIKVGLPMVAAIAGILTALAAPAAPIVVPIAASVVLAKWIYDVYQASHDHLQRFISYIVDLTIILQVLHLLSDKDKELSIRAIKLAVTAYHDSLVSVNVHTEVREYVRRSTIRDRADRDILDKVTQLVNMHSIGIGEIFAVREEVRARFVDGPSGETW